MDGNKNKDQRPQECHVTACPTTIGTCFNRITNTPSRSSVFEINKYTFDGVSNKGDIKTYSNPFDEQIGAHYFRIRVKSFAAIVNQQLEITSQVNNKEKT
jgi:hypothetical protein